MPVGTAMIGMRFLALRSIEPFTVAGLIPSVATRDVVSAGLFGEVWFQPTIAVVQATRIGVRAKAALRWSARWLQACAPSSCSVAARRMAGTAPSMMGFVRISCRPAAQVAGATAWVVLALGRHWWMLDVAGARALFIDSAGLRPAGLCQLAFLAGVCNLSGRQIRWPGFVEAAVSSPWRGRGGDPGGAFIPQPHTVPAPLHSRAA